MREELPGRPCSVAAALNLIGEKWTLLAVREIAFGNKRFDVIAKNTGAPRDRLTARLRTLEAAGVVERRQYSDHPPRYEYELTQAGLELRSVLTVLRAWGDKWAVDSPPTAFVHSCGHELDPAIICRHCEAEIDTDDLKVRVLTPGWTRRGPAADCRPTASRLRAHRGPQAERARDQLAVRARPLERGRPPGEVLEHDVGGGVGHRVDRLALLVEGAVHAGMTTLLRMGTDSVSTNTWARCSIARTPPAMPPE